MFGLLRLFHDRLSSLVSRAALGLKGDFDPFMVSIRIAGVYIVFGMLWILSSDKILESLVNDKSTLTQISMLKGWIYVFLTGFIIYTLIFFAFQELRKYQGELRRSAYLDAVTKLPNRHALTEQASALLQTASVQPSAIFFIDLDNLKFVNDSLGHSYGDLLLKQVARKLSDLLPAGGSIYRLSGDEFVVHLPISEDKQELESFAGLVLDSFQSPFRIEESTVHSTVSLGIAIYPDHGEDMHQLLKNADIAMYQAKQAGKNQYRIFSAPMKAELTRRIDMEKNLRNALQNGEFLLHYQPQLDVEANKVVGFEALLRWNNPQLGFVSPGTFIQIAEEHHMIIPIGRWVLRTACDFIRKLQQDTGYPYSVAVNVSILQLIQNDFVPFVEETLTMSGLSPESLEIEITESIFMESFEQIQDKLHFLRKQGIRIALDDFGKGYSSLNRLLQLPITTLKIDKSFTDGITQDEKNKSLVYGIMMIGQSLGIHIVAEGVEHVSQLEYLASNKCRYIQGYLFSKPLPEKEIRPLLQRHASLLPS